MSVPEDSDARSALPTTSEELNSLQGIHYEMPSDLDAFYRMYARPQLRYAATVLGDMKAAQSVVRRLYTHLSLNWAVVLLEDGGPEAYAWRVLKMSVELHMRMTVGPAADGRSTTPAGNARTTAVHEAVRATLENMRTQLAAIESPPRPLYGHRRTAGTPVRRDHPAIRAGLPLQTGRQHHGHQPGHGPDPPAPGPQANRHQARHRPG